MVPPWKRNDLFYDCLPYETCWYSLKQFVPIFLTGNLFISIADTNIQRLQAVQKQLNVKDITLKCIFVAAKPCYYWIFL